MDSCDKLFDQDDPEHGSKGPLGLQCICFNFILKTSVGSQKSTQAFGAPGKSEKPLITNKVTTSFSDSPCTPKAYASFLRPTEVFRFITQLTPEMRQPCLKKWSLTGVNSHFSPRSDVFQDNLSRNFICNYTAAFRVWFISRHFRTENVSIWLIFDHSSTKITPRWGKR